MPELPEVETVVRDLNKKVRGLRVLSVWSDTPKQIRDYSAPGRRLTDKDYAAAKKNFARFTRDIVGEKVLEARRRAKNILIYLTGNKVLLVHQKMTGHLLVGKWRLVKGKMVGVEPVAVAKDPYNSYIHLVLTLSNKKQLALSDLRKFAKVILGTNEQIENLTELTSLGPDALDSQLTLKQFSGIISSKGPTIKQVLLNPNVIAGIGNIYSDEMLWRAKIHPLRKPGSLSDYEIKRLYQAMRQVLSKAVRLRGTSTSDFRDTAGKKGHYTSHRLVYQREGERCQRCATAIKRIKVGGRSAHFCPKCQKATRLYASKEKKAQH